MNHTCASASALSLLFMAGLAHASAPSFHILQSQGRDINAVSLSGDGQRIVGSYVVTGGASYQAIYIDWRNSLAPVALVPNGNVVKCNYDGHTVIGWITDGNLQWRAVIWTDTDFTIVQPRTGTMTSSLSDVTADGTTFVGYAFTPNGPSGATWTRQNGWSVLAPSTFQGCQNTQAVCISADGHRIVGIANHCQSEGFADMEAVSWNPAISGLGWQADSYATLPDAISADGSTIVGYIYTPVGTDSATYTPCRWTAAGMQPLTDGLLNDYAAARGVSADGSVIVGHNGNGPFIWMESTGLVNLNDYAAGYVDLDGWTLTTATAISNDGTVIIGSATREGVYTSFVLDLGTPCIADYNHDGYVDFFDYLDFVQDFASGSMNADVNHDRVLDFFDYLDFVQAFSTNCY